MTLSEQNYFRVLSLAGLTALASLFSIGFGILTARLLGPSGRGDLALVITIASTGAIVSSLGINVAARHHLPLARHGVTLNHYHSLGLVLVVLCAVGCGAIGWAYFGTSAPDLVGLTALMGGAACASYLEIDALNTLGIIRGSTGIVCIGAALQIGLFGGWSLFGHPTTTVALIAAIAGYLIQVLLAVLTLALASHSIRPSVSGNAWWRLGKMGIPGLGVSAGQSLIFRFDRYVIAAVMGPAALGVYSIAVTGSEITRIIPQAWGQFAQFRTASEHSSVDQIPRDRARVLLASLPIIALLALFAPEIIMVTMGPRYLGAVTPWRLLSIGEIGVIAYQIDSRLLSALGKTVVVGLIGVIGLVLVVGLDLLLVPTHGLAGAGAASAITYLVLGGCGATAFHRWFKRTRSLSRTVQPVQDPDLL